MTTSSPSSDVRAVPRAAVRIAGVEVASVLIPVRNPARTDQVVGEVALGTAADVDRAVDAARAAFGRWSATAPMQRAERLRAAARQIAGRVDEIAEVLTLEQGKTLAESAIDVGGAARILDYYADLAGTLEHDEVFREDHRGTIYLGRRPMGVTGVIVPWNSPVYLALLGVAPALIAGNPVVVKASEYAPLALGMVLDILADALPEGVVSSVPGDAEAGAAIARHPLIRKLFFTGSTKTGQQVMRDAAGNLKSLSLELGGNDPAIILESARITDTLVDELVKGVFTTTGQICFAVKRIYVHESHYRDFLERFLAATATIVVGRGQDPRTTMGPLNNRPQFDRVQGLLDRIRASGATLHTVGEQLDPTGWDSGLFVLPTVVTDVPPDAEIVTCEQFGPIIPVVSFADDDEVVAHANATEFGLAASVWTEDRAHALAVARRLQCGSVFVNVHRVGASDVSMPFGGFKMSGSGRGHGVPALHGCLEMQAIADYTDVSGFPDVRLVNRDAFENPAAEEVGHEPR